MTLRFELSTETTLDGSYPIVVRCDSIEAEEYAFQFACNIEELKDLRAEANKGIRDFIKVEKQRLKQHQSGKAARIRARVLKDCLRRGK